MQQLHINQSNETELNRLFEQALDIVKTDGHVELSVESEKCLHALRLKLFAEGLLVQRVRKLYRLIVKENLNNRLSA